MLLTTCSDTSEAALLKSRLEASGIHTVVQGEQHRSMLGMMGSFIELRVYVAKRDEETARALLESAPAGPASDEADGPPAPGPEEPVGDTHTRRRRRIGWVLIFVLFWPAGALVVLGARELVERLTPAPRYTSEAGAFRVAFPEPPTVQSQSVEGMYDGGPVQVHRYASWDRKSFVGYLVQYHSPDVPPEALAEFARTLPEQTAEMLEGTFVSREELRIDGHPAQSFRLARSAKVRDQPGAFDVAVAQVLAGARLYELIVTTSPQSSPTLDPRDVTRFFESFELTASPAPPRKAP